jgi:hypothetical protein
MNCTKQMLKNLSAISALVPISANGSEYFEEMETYISPF